MKKRNNKLALSFILALGMIFTLAIPVSAGSIAKVELGTTSPFAVLAGTTITNTGPTTISGDAGGDVGVHPGSAFTGQADVTLSGAAHLADAVAGTAKEDLVTAYNDAAGRTKTSDIVADLGGTTLKSGVYHSGSSIFITGTLTLDAEGDPDAVFIFQAGSTLITASYSKIELINGARYCRVFWQVGSSATLGTYSTFVGHIFALTSITANTGATIQGQLLARNGAVTLDNNVITNGFCATSTTPVEDTPAIKIVKTADPLTLASGGGAVTYTFKVTNPGDVALSDVSVTDDKINTVTYVSGDVNGDSLLQTSETWIYTATAKLTATTTNTATATGSANGVTVTDTSSVKVTVTPPVTPVTPVTTTVTGGKMADTATPWYSILLLGSALIIAGVAGLWTKKRYE